MAHSDVVVVDRDVVGTNFFAPSHIAKDGNLARLRDRIVAEDNLDGNERLKGHGNHDLVRSAGLTWHVEPDSTQVRVEVGVTRVH